MLVDDQHGAPDVADVLEGVVLEARDTDGQEQVVMARDVDEVREGGVEDEAAGGVPSELRGDRSSEGLAVEAGSVPRGPCGSPSGTAMPLPHRCRFPPRRAFPGCGRIPGNRR